MKCERSHFLYGWIESDIWLSPFVICAMPCHWWHQYAFVLSLFVLIRGRQERQQYNTNNKQRHKNSCTMLKTWIVWFISARWLCSPEKSFIFSWPTQTSHHFTLRRFNWIHYLFFFHFFPPRLMFYFLLLKFCCVFILHL